MARPSQKGITLKKSKKYDTSGLIEDQYEPGSGRRVLKNLLGINRKREMDRLEAREQLRAIEEVSRSFDENHCFTAQDICKIHEIWLGPVYPWAGRYRQVNISKGGFEFAKAMAVAANMQEFERSVLRKYTPCRNMPLDQIIEALAIVHVELVLIHPFREGNGRMTRLLSILMGWQAQLPTLDFGGITGRKKSEYFAAVRTGLARNYEPMTEIFRSIVNRTLKKT